MMNPMNNTKYGTSTDPYVYGFTEGGWKDCYARNTLMPQFYNALDLAWKIVIADQVKYRDNVGNGINEASNVTATYDKVWLPAKIEVCNSVYRANPEEQNHQEQYDYFKNGGSYTRYRHSQQTETAWWFCSSPYVDSNSEFICVSTSGGMGYARASFSLGMTPCWSISE